MNEIWKQKSLRDAGVSLIDCEHRTPPESAAGYCYVAIPQLKEGRLDLADVRHISAEHYVEWTRKAKPQAHDVILSRRCNPGETAFVPPGLECALGQNLVLLRADEHFMYPPFLRWLVRGDEWWRQIRKFINVGAVFDSLRCADIPNFELSIPPLSEQRMIAEILGALDDKIELNRRITKTIESMARAVFKDWFIDFGPVHANAGRFSESTLFNELAPIFPNSLDESNRPIGWEVTNLAKLTSKIGSGATPRGGKEVYVSVGMNFIRSQNVHDDQFVWNGLVKITDQQAERLRNVAVETNDILINITGDSILRTCIVDPAVLPARVNQHVSIIRAREEIPARFLYLFLTQTSTKAQLLGNDAGGSRAAITKGHLESLPILLPSTTVLTAFENLTAPWFDRIARNSHENRTLASLRDTLLPKLVSGEVRTTKAERMIEAVL